MNQADGECSEHPSLAGHRLSLSDLFCTEPFLPPSPSAAYRTTGLLAAASGLGGLRLLDGCGSSMVVGPSNPFFADAFQNERLVQPYLHEQFQWKHGLQAKYRVADYLACHPSVSLSAIAPFCAVGFSLERPGRQVTSAMRSELIIWLGKVNRKLGYDIETFLLAVNYVDRFLGASVISADRLQLLGLAAVLVAAKKVTIAIAVHLTDD